MVASHGQTKKRAAILANDRRGEKEPETTVVGGRVRLNVCCGRPQARECEGAREEEVGAETRADA
eukprot:5927035-Lingulodinium_polyedra.AAC.1